VKSGSEIPTSLLARPVAGLNLSPGTLNDQLGPQPMLLVFLRHFGCIFCRETLADMRAFSERDPNFPKILFFFQGSTTEGRALLRRYWPEVGAVADPTALFYTGFGVERGGLIRNLGPSVLAAKSRAESKGHSNGERSGDIWRMPGAFLVSNRRVFWAHEYRHAADHPSYEEISELAARKLGESP
jgi:hypothetical protein